MFNRLLKSRSAAALFVLLSLFPAASDVAAQSSRAAAPDSTLTRQTLEAYFSGDRRGLAEAHQRALAMEQAAGDARALRISDAILYLFNSTNPDREKFLLGQELALQESRSQELRSSILWSLLSDEYYELALLSGENRFNRLTRIFNRASSAVSRAALFQPQAAAQLLLDGVYSARKGRTPTDRERRMLYLGRKFLEKHPEAPEAVEVRELLTQLRTKFDTDRARRDKLAGISLLEQGKPVSAEFHLERASLLAPDDKETREALVRARASRDDAEVHAARSLSVAPMESKLDEADRRTLEDACRALMRGDGDKLVSIASSSAAVQDSAVFALACLAEKYNRHEDALGRMKQLALAAPQSPGGRAAAAALANSNYDLEQGFRESLDELARRRREYVLTGNRSNEDTAFAAGGAALQSGASAAVGLPALFFTDALVRGFAERFKSQVAADSALDAGARLLRRYPDTPRARETAAQLASLSKRTGDLDRTGEYLKDAGIDPESDPKLRENKARALHNEAMTAGDFVRRKSLLEQVVRQYPDCKIAESSTKELAKLPPTLEPGSVVLTGKMLQQDTRLARSLGVAGELVDGKNSNGEVAEEGLAINGRGDRVSFRLRDGDSFYETVIPDNSRERLLAAARQLRAGYERAEAGKRAEQHRWFPFSLEGGAGSAGAEISPRIQPYKDNEEQMKYFK